MANHLRASQSARAKSTIHFKISLEIRNSFTHSFLNIYLMENNFTFSLIVLCDFQVGLAVGDIDKIQVNALIDRYVMQVEQPTLH